MSAVDQTIKKLIIEKIERTDDMSLLDLILKLLVAEGSD